MDPIADMLVRINNAVRVRKEMVDVPHSRLKEEIARIMLAEGYIAKHDIFTRLNKKYLRIWLKYTADKKSVIEGVKRVSKPGRRIYAGTRSIPRIRSGFGTVIVSTPRGLMTDEEARKNRLGGEILCYIW